MNKTRAGEWVSDLVKGILQEPEVSPAVIPMAGAACDDPGKVAVAATGDSLDLQIEPPTSATTPTSLEPQIIVEPKQGRTSAQLANIILRALHSVEGCPKQGLEITVYGSNPWNAMLRITTAAVMKPAAAKHWRDRVRVLVQLLREQFDLLETEDELSKNETSLGSTINPQRDHSA